MATLMIRSLDEGKTFFADSFHLRFARMRRRLRAWAEAISGLGSYRLVLVTLTYAPGNSWQPNHIRDFMLLIRRHLKDGLIAYSWVSELHKNGRIHYHVVLVLRPWAYISFPDSSGLWPYGMTNVISIRSPFYLLRYVGKEYQKDFSRFPKGARLFAVVILSFFSFPFRFSSLPSWLSSLFSSFLVPRYLIPRRAGGGGWFVGRFLFRSPYVVSLVDT